MGGVSLWKRHLTWEPSGKEAVFWGKVFLVERTANKNTITGLDLVYLRNRKAAILTADGMEHHEQRSHRGRQERLAELVSRASWINVRSLF